MAGVAAKNVAIQYVQTELPYLVCGICSSKDYNLVRAGVACMRYNSSPSRYPQKHCPGIMVQGTNTIAVLANQVTHNVVDLS